MSGQDIPWKGTVMSKVTDVRVVDGQEAAGLPELSDELRVAVGLQVMAELMDDEITATVGPKHAKLADRTAVRHASTTGSVVLGGRKVTVRRPRARTTDGREVALASYAMFAGEDQLEAVAFARMLAGPAAPPPPAAPRPGRAGGGDAARAHPPTPLYPPVPPPDAPAPRHQGAPPGGAGAPAAGRPAAPAPRCAGTPPTA